MKKIWSSQEIENHYLTSNNDNLYKILNGKTNYLKSLEQKKNNSIKLLDTQKYGIIKDRLLRENLFQRDYYLFIKSEKQLLKKPSKRKFYFTPDLKISILSQEERDYPNRYRKKDFDTDVFSSMYIDGNYTDFPKKSPLKMSLAMKRKKIIINKKCKTIDKESPFYNSKKSSKDNIFEKNIIFNKNINKIEKIKVNPFLTSIGSKVVVTNPHSSEKKSITGTNYFVNKNCK